MFANVPRVEGDLVLAVAGVNDCTVCMDAVGNDLSVHVSIQTGPDIF